MGPPQESGVSPTGGEARRLRSCADTGAACSEPPAGQPTGTAPARFHRSCATTCPTSRRRDSRRRRCRGWAACNGSRCGSPAAMRIARPAEAGGVARAGRGAKPGVPRVPCGDRILTWPAQSHAGSRASSRRARWDRPRPSGRSAGSRAPRAQVAAARWSASRSASAIAVSVGFAAPAVGNTDEPTTNRFSTAWTRSVSSTTPRRGSACMRVVPA